MDHGPFDGRATGPARARDPLSRVVDSEWRRRRGGRRRLRGRRLRSRRHMSDRGRWPDLGLCRKLGGLRRRAGLPGRERFHHDGGPVHADLAEGLGDRLAVEPRRDDRVRAPAKCLVDHALHHLLPALVDQLRVLRYLPAAGGGEVPEYTQLVYESRQQVVQRMVDEALRRGANAIVATRFDSEAIAQAFSEICVYGTAVVVEPLAAGQPGATPQSAQLAAQAQVRPPAPVAHVPPAAQPPAAQPPTAAAPPPPL